MKYKEYGESMHPLTKEWFLENRLIQGLLIQ